MQENGIQPDPQPATPPIRQSPTPSMGPQEWITFWEQQAEQRARLLRHRRDPDRWRELMVTESPQAEQAMRVVDRLWEAPLPFEFRALASALIQQRIEDAMPVPTHPDEPLRRELETMIINQQRQTARQATSMS